MKTDKISGLIYISEGKLNIDKLTNNGLEIKNKIEQLLALRDVVQDQLLEHEKEVQRSFKDLPKIQNQWDIESMISDIEKEKLNGN